jgi:hypothetical protein
MSTIELETDCAGHPVYPWSCPHCGTRSTPYQRPCRGDHLTCCRCRTEFIVDRNGEISTPWPGLHRHVQCATGGPFENYALFGRAALHRDSRFSEREIYNARLRVISVYENTTRGVADGGYEDESG